MSMQLFAHAHNYGLLPAKKRQDKRNVGVWGGMESSIRQWTISLSSNQPGYEVAQDAPLRNIELNFVFLLRFGEIHVQFNSDFGRCVIASRLLCWRHSTFLAFLLNKWNYFRLTGEPAKSFVFCQPDILSLRNGFANGIQISSSLQPSDDDNDNVGISSSLKHSSCLAKSP